MTVHPVAEGITNPPIDELLTQSDSKYKLVLFAAKRARQINAYYSQLGEGLLDHVGPLVETGPGEAAVHRPARGQRRCADCTDIDPDAEAEESGRRARRWSSRPEPDPVSTVLGRRPPAVGVDPAPRRPAVSRIVLGVAGGIAAYKACELLRRLPAAGHEVTVVPTESALQFVGAATWAALSGRPVHTEVWDDVHAGAARRGSASEADLVLVAPATADLLARAATGRADDLLTNVLLTAHVPGGDGPGHAHRDVAARRHPGQRRHPALARRRRRRPRLRPAHRRRLRARPAARPGRALRRRRRRAGRPRRSPRRAAAQDLAGLRVAVSAGGTREHLDPVRFLGNSSSGLMGWALARAAALRGAEVTPGRGQRRPRPRPPAVPVTPVASTADLDAGDDRAAAATPTSS